MIIKRYEVCCSKYKFFDVRGCSSLYLSGMAEVGLTEGVAVWRPLLVHDKDDIYRFAHKYGVPYLQDSTPSWSTRGKLRQELLPILLDIYGTGCMHNLSSLAADSDAMRSLVQDTVFDPFLRSINRCDCGISVQITDFYRNQSAVFWAEALKQIMHSMSMSLVREKAVQNFVGRIHMLAKDAVAVELESPHTPGARRVSFQLDQRAARIMSGWLELRKGFNCFIDDNNTLCILRPGVLRPSGSAARQSRGKRFEGAAWGEPPCVEIAVSADCLPCSVVVVESGSNGVELKLPLDLVAGDPLRLVAGSEISPPLQACLLDMRVCLTALTALNLGYPLSPRMLASTEPTLQRVSVSFSVEFGAWTISVRLTSSGQASFQVVTGRSTLIRPTSPESMVYSDGEQSDYEDDGIWKWSPGERSERKLSMPPEPEYEVLPLLTDIHDVLNGRFCYEFPVFHHNCRPALEENVCDNADGSTSVASVVHLQLVAGMTASGVRDLHIGSLRSLETKIREGLPLVCPVIVDDADSSTSKKTKKRNKDVEVTGADKLCTVTVSYSYTISNENRGHDMN